MAAIAVCRRSGNTALRVSCARTCRNTQPCQHHQQQPHDQRRRASSHANVHSYAPSKRWPRTRHWRNRLPVTDLRELVSHSSRNQGSFIGEVTNQHPAWECSLICSVGAVTRMLRCLCSMQRMWHESAAALLPSPRACAAAKEARLVEEMQVERAAC